MSRKVNLDPASVLDDNEPTELYQQYRGPSASRNSYAVVDVMRSNEPAMQWEKSQHYLSPVLSKAYSA